MKQTEPKLKTDKGSGAMPKSLKAGTKELRRKIALTSLRVLTPKLKREIDALLERMDHGESVPRPFTSMLKQKFAEKCLEGCEIGFGFGKNAESILKELNVRRLYCVEPFLGDPSFLQGGKLTRYYENLDDELEQLERLEKLKKDERIRFLKVTSDEAFNGLLPGNLDFIYIDGNHVFDFCLRDIENSVRHLAFNGYVGGHDFDVKFPGVIEAVLRYTASKGVAPEICYPDFWFAKADIKARAP